MNEIQLKKWEAVRKNGQLNFILVQALKYALFMTAGSTFFYYVLQQPYSIKVVVSIFFIVYLASGFFLFSRAWKRNEKAYLSHTGKHT